MGFIGNQSVGVVKTTFNDFKGVLADYAALDAEVGMVDGEMYVTSDNNHGWLYDGTTWVDIGEIRGPQGVQGPQGPGGDVGTITGITRISGDGSAGVTDTYEITYNNSDTGTFDVYNGLDGDGATNIVAGTNIIIDATDVTSPIISAIDTTYTNVSELVNDAGYITTETSHPADVLVAQDITDIGNLSGINTGDQTTITGNAGTATILETTRTINGVDFNGSANIEINAVDSTARIASSEKGQANGVATLDGLGLIPTAQLPSYVDDVIMAADLTAIETLTLESGKVYVAEDTNITYRWSGTDTTMVQIGSDLALGVTSSTAYRGDLGKIAYDHSQSAHAPVNSDNTASNETSHGTILLGIDNISVSTADTSLNLSGNGTGVANIDGNSETVTNGVYTQNVLSAISDTNKLITQEDIAALGGGDMAKSVYDTTNTGVVDNSELVNGLTVETAVPALAVFTDTVYDDTVLTAAVGLNTAKETNVTTDLSTTTTATTNTVVSSDGTDAVLSAATPTVAGVMTGADKLKLDGIATGAEVNDTNTTLQGNVFNGVEQLVKTDTTGRLPAIDGSLLTGIDSLPDQTGNTGKYLTTDGTDATWDVLDITTFTELQTAVGGETVITVPTYTVGAEQLIVAIEGNVQYLGTDYTETDATTITLTTALTEDEKILIQKV